MLNFADRLTLERPDWFRCMLEFYDMHLLPVAARGVIDIVYISTVVPKSNPED